MVGSLGMSSSQETHDFGKTLLEILSKAEQVLYDYPLCNSCLGRLFSRYGIGLANWERGFALKVLLAMKLYEDYLENKVSKDYVYRIAVNAGESIASMYAKISGVAKLEQRKCYICSNLYTTDLLLSIARDACKELQAFNAKTFLVGVRLSRVFVERELEVYSRYGFTSAESIKREIKREVGKLVRNLCGLEPDFTKADAVALVEVSSDFKYHVKVEPSPICFRGVYWKLGRRISHVPWYTRNGVKKYPLSIQEVVEQALKDVFMSAKVVIHAAGREDVDARMLGSGRPLVIEVKEPRYRLVSTDSLNSLVIAKLYNAPVRLAITGFSSKKEVRLIKESSKKKRKAYRITVYSLDGAVSEHELSFLEEFFKNRAVKQLTPTRILRRKKERVRVREVHVLKAIPLSPRVFEVILLCDGGLYVKELVHCDEGRTSPCFSSVLGKRLQPAELDVLYVEE